MKLNIIKINIIKQWYSNKKINLKKTEKNSILKPETNSDSHSKKSKGCRPISHKKETIMNKNKKKKFNLLELKKKNLFFLKYIIKKIKEKEKIHSQLIIWIKKRNILILLKTLIQDQFIKINK